MAALFAAAPPSSVYTVAAELVIATRNADFRSFVELAEPTEAETETLSPESTALFAEPFASSNARARTMVNRLSVPSGYHVTLNVLSAVSPSMSTPLPWLRLMPYHVDPSSEPSKITPSSEVSVPPPTVAVIENDVVPTNVFTSGAVTVTVAGAILSAAVVFDVAASLSAASS